MTLRHHLGWLVLVLAFAGCGPGDAKKTTVKGTVKIDGSPMASGKIAFEPTDGTVPVILDIKDGKYEGQVTLGKKKVMVMSYKMMPPPKTGMTGPEYEKEVEVNTIPAKYNSQSTDVREIKDGTNEFDISVSAK